MQSRTASFVLILVLVGSAGFWGCDANSSSDDSSAGSGNSAQAGSPQVGAGAPGSGGSTGGASTSGGAPTSGGAGTTGMAGTSSQGGSPPQGGTGGAIAGGTANGGASAGTGGTPSDAGTSNGGASAGTGGSAGGPQGGCNGALFCDDFEAHETGKPPGMMWTQRVKDGAVSVDETQGYSGTKSVKFTTQATSGVKTAFIQFNSDSVFPVMGNAFFGRMMVRLESAPTESVHWTILQATGPVPGQDYRAQYRYGGQHPVTDGAMFVGSQLMANYETPDSYGGKGPSTDCWHHANGTVLPTGKWVCIEWEFNGPMNQMRFWMDGTAIEDLTVTGTGQGCVSQGDGYVWTAPTFSELEVGWEAYQPDEARTLFIDDVAIGTTRIGCPQ